MEYSKCAVMLLGRLVDPENQKGRWVQLEVVENAKEQEEVIQEYQNVFGYANISFCTVAISDSELSEFKKSALRKLFLYLNGPVTKLMCALNSKKV